MKIAICSDSAPERDALSSFVAACGENDLRITSVENRFALRLALSGETFDLLIVALNGVNGMEAAIDARERDKNLRLIWISDMPEFSMQAYRLRAQDFLPKPIAFEDLRAAIKRCVKKAI